MLSFVWINVSSAPWTRASLCVSSADVASSRKTVRSNGETIRLGNSHKTRPTVAELTDPWHPQHYPRDGDPLALTARQPHPLLPDPRLEAVLKLLDKLPRVCLLGRDSEVFFGVRILLQPVWAQHGS